MNVDYKCKINIHLKKKNLLVIETHVLIYFNEGFNQLIRKFQ